MKKLIFTALAVSCSATLAAKVTTLPALPTGELPDTETVTNAALNISAERLDTLRFQLAFASCATNEVALAVGADSDSDGDLSFEEAAFVWGCDCGQWYLADLESGAVCTPGSAAPNGFVLEGNSLLIRSRAFNPAWNLVKVVKRGLGDVGETVTQVEKRKTLYFSVR